MAERIKAAIVGPGNIGIDLMEKIRHRGRGLDLAMMVGIDENSEGIRRAASYGVDTEVSGLARLLADESIKIVFEATSAKAHTANAPLYKRAGKIAIDLTPAAVGPYVVPVLNMDEHLHADNMNMVTCGGQATTPIVGAVARVHRVRYAEIVSAISSMSAGPGTRANIDEFTHTTAKALETVGGAGRGKAIIILNPAQPPIYMRNTIYCQVEGEPDMARVAASVESMVAALKAYVPGYEVILPPTYDGARIVTTIQVEGAGDYLPKYAGNLDIITCAALEVAERVAGRLQGGQSHA